MSDDQARDEAAYIRRQHALEAGDYRAVPCDCCYERPAHAGLLVFGCSRVAGRRRFPFRSSRQARV